MTDSGYYRNIRNEIVTLVNTSATNILDVGCGAGFLGEKLKFLQPNRCVIGIEINTEQAIEAKNKLDDVIIGDVQTLLLPFENNFFDCIIFADILEHLSEPEKVLKKFNPFLKQNGTIILSIPNMRHYTVILQLILRGWEYKDFGHFDRTHLRFYSLKSIRDLITSAGYKIQKIEPRIVASKKAKVINFICFNKLSDFLAMQYICTAVK